MNGQENNQSISRPLSLQSLSLGKNLELNQNIQRLAHNERFLNSMAEYMYKETREVLASIDKLKRVTNFAQFKQQSEEIFGQNNLAIRLLSMLIREMTLKDQDALNQILKELDKDPIDLRELLNLDSVNRILLASLLYKDGTLYQLHLERMLAGICFDILHRNPQYDFCTEYMDYLSGLIMEQIERYMKSSENAPIDKLIKVSQFLSRNEQLLKQVASGLSQVIETMIDDRNINYDQIKGILSAFRNNTEFLSSDAICSLQECIKYFIHEYYNDNVNFLDKINSTLDLFQNNPRLLLLDRDIVNGLNAIVKDLMNHYANCISYENRLNSILSIFSNNPEFLSNELINCAINVYLEAPGMRDMILNQILRSALHLETLDSGLRMRIENLLQASQEVTPNTSETQYQDMISRHSIRENSQRHSQSLNLLTRSDSSNGSQGSRDLQDSCRFDSGVKSKILSSVKSAMREHRRSHGKMLEIERGNRNTCCTLL